MNWPKLVECRWRRGHRHWRLGGKPLGPFQCRQRWSEMLRLEDAFLAHPSERHFAYPLSKQTMIGSGQIYVLLARLERIGWLKSGWEDIDPTVAGRPRRRWYALSTAAKNADV